MRPIERRKRDATYEDLLALPREVNGEIVDGALYVSPRPGSSHARATSTLGIELGGPFDRGRGPGGWWILDEPELHLGDAIVVPDLAGWQRTRMPAMKSQPHFTLAPDWACEVLSPATARFDRGKKLGVYAKAAVPHVWLVSPEARTIEVLRLSGDLYTIVTVAGEEARARLEPFDAIELEVEALWLPSEEPEL